MAANSFFFFREHESVTALPGQTSDRLSKPKQITTDTGESYLIFNHDRPTRVSSWNVETISVEFHFGLSSNLISSVSSPRRRKLDRTVKVYTFFIYFSDDTTACLFGKFDGKGLRFRNFCKRTFQYSSREILPFHCIYSKVSSRFLQVYLCILQMFAHYISFLSLPATLKEAR